MTGYVYVTASKEGGTTYVGVTNALARRTPEHKSGRGSSFTFAGLAGETFCTVAVLNRHGMDSRVCARRFAPCSALE
ncbi:hypothetical protein FJ567_26700 [Mesorhizobium sp. B2-4-16]|nr:hypothetical protein FJ567_26700 [Mesorhizobium sp. B2-4-16]TPL60948.1 hypothetical protein FJ956_26670 [Mesorhizobium sp. B2-4-3]